VADRWLHPAGTTHTRRETSEWLYDSHHPSAIPCPYPYLDFHKTHAQSLPKPNCPQLPYFQTRVCHV